MRRGGSTVGDRAASSSAATSPPQLPAGANHDSERAAVRSVGGAGPRAAPRVQPGTSRTSLIRKSAPGAEDCERPWARPGDDRGGVNITKFTFETLANTRRRREEEESSSSSSFFSLGEHTLPSPSPPPSPSPLPLPLPHAHPHPHPRPHPHPHPHPWGGKDTDNAAGADLSHTQITDAGATLAAALDGTTAALTPALMYLLDYF